MRPSLGSLLLLALACGGTPPAPEAPPAPPEVSEGGSTPAHRCEAPDDGVGEAALRARLREVPECAALRLALAHTLAAEDRCDEAEAELNALAAGPAAADGRRAFVRLAAGTCGDRRRVALAEAFCEAMLAEDGEAATWIACGRLEEARGETARAMERYARASELDPSALEAIEAPAELALRFRDFPVAAAHYERLTEAAPQRASAWRGLAHARRGRGDLPSAIAAMERAVALDGAAAEPRYHLAFWLRESGAHEPAVAQLRAFLVIAADEPGLASARQRAQETLERWRRGR